MRALRCRLLPAGEETRKTLELQKRLLWSLSGYRPLDLVDGGTGGIGDVDVKIRRTYISPGLTATPHQRPLKRLHRVPPSPSPES